MAPPSSPAYPSTAYIVSLIAGILIGLYGLVIMIEAAILSSTLESIVPGATAIVIGFGAIGLILGIIIAVLAMRLKSNPATVKTSGVLILVLSLISIIGGGGYFIGLILGLVGGILALTWKAPAPTPPAYGQPGYGAAAAPTFAGPAQRYCSACGTANLASAKYCAKCGAPLS